MAENTFITALKCFAGTDESHAVAVTLREGGAMMCARKDVMGLAGAAMPASIAIDNALEPQI